MASPSEAVEQLCMGCGFCCDGSLFACASLQKDENPPVGPTWEGTGGNLVFAMPCRCFDGKCTIYDARPKTCIGYYCDTAKLVKSGRLGLARAQTRIETMRAHIADFRKLTGDFETPVPKLVCSTIDGYKLQRKARSCTEADRRTARAAYRYRVLKNRYFAGRYKRRMRRLSRAISRLLPHWARARGKNS